MPEWPPWVTANEAYADSFSASSVEETLSNPAPPYSSGIPPPSNPTSPAFFSTCGIKPSLCCSSSAASGKTSFATNSSAVWPISRWSPVKSAGVNTSSGRHAEIKNPPPRIKFCVTVVVAICPPRCTKNVAVLRRNQKFSSALCCFLDFLHVLRGKFVLRGPGQNCLQIMGRGAQSLIDFCRDVNLRGSFFT